MFGVFGLKKEQVYSPGYVTNYARILRYCVYAQGAIGILSIIIILFNIQLSFSPVILLIFASIYTYIAIRRIPTFHLLLLVTSININTITLVLMVYYTLISVLDYSGWFIFIYWSLLTLFEVFVITLIWKVFKGTYGSIEDFKEERTDNLFFTQNPLLAFRQDANFGGYDNNSQPTNISNNNTAQRSNYGFPGHGNVLGSS